jgi:hypothetical protein
MRSQAAMAVVCGLALMLQGNEPGFGLGLNVKKGSSAFQVKAYGFSPEQIKTFEMTPAQNVLARL